MSQILFVTIPLCLLLAVAVDAQNTGKKAPGLNFLPPEIDETKLFGKLNLTQVLALPQPPPPPAADRNIKIELIDGKPVQRVDMPLEKLPDIIEDKTGETKIFNYAITDNGIVPLKLNVGSSASRNSNRTPPINPAAPQAAAPATQSRRQANTFSLLS